MTHWLLLHTKPFKESSLHRELNARQVNSFFPQLKVKPVNPRARKRVPYFPGYLFIQIDKDNPELNALRWLPGVQGWVQFGDEIATVSEEIIQGIQRHVDRLNAETSQGAERFQHGEPLQIIGGPFEGYSAIFDSALSGPDRVRVLIQLVHDKQLPVIVPGQLLQSKKKH